MVLAVCPPKKAANSKLLENAINAKCGKLDEDEMNGNFFERGYRV
ncbi:hypothetical protein ACLD72_018405 [Paenibacillus sp. TH7-28]